MRIVFAGTPEFAVPSLRALAADPDHELVGVITRADAPIGRKRVLTPSPVAQLADELGVPTLKTIRLDDTATQWVADRAPDLGVIVAYGGLVREPLLTLPRLGWVNLHFSELPRWRGAAPVQRALEAGEQRLGMTVFRLVAELDAGDVLTMAHHEFAPGTSAGEALTLLADAGTKPLRDAVRLLAQDSEAGDAQEGEVTFAAKLTREDGRLDLAQPAAAVLAHWAGVTPEPGAYVMLDEQPVKLHEVRSPQAELAQPVSVTEPLGTVTAHQGAVLLHLSDGPLELVRVQPAGKPAMVAADWLRGRGGRVVLS